jgi:hypothetical protein
MDVLALFREEGLLPSVMEEAPEEPQWSRWLHYYPDLVATMAAQAGVPEAEVIEHLGQIVADLRAEKKLALLSDGEVVRRYLDQFVATADETPAIGQPIVTTRKE